MCPRFGQDATDGSSGPGLRSEGSATGQDAMHFEGHANRTPAGAGNGPAAVFGRLCTEPMSSCGRCPADRNARMNGRLFWGAPQTPWSSVSVTGTAPSLRVVSGTALTPASLRSPSTPERHFCYPFHAEAPPRRPRAKKGSSYLSDHLGILLMSRVSLPWPPPRHQTSKPLHISAHNTVYLPTTLTPFPQSHQMDL